MLICLMLQCLSKCHMKPLMCGALRFLHSVGHSCSHNWSYGDFVMSLQGLGKFSFLKTSRTCSSGQAQANAVHLVCVPCNFKRCMSLSDHVSCCALFVNFENLSHTTWVITWVLL